MVNALLVLMLLGVVVEALCSVGAISVAACAVGEKHVAPMLRRRAAVAGIIGATLIFRLAAG